MIAIEGAGVSDARLADLGIAIGETGRPVLGYSEAFRDYLEEGERANRYFNTADAWNCPVASFLNDRLPTGSPWCVDGVTARVGEVAIDLGETMFAFVRRLDCATACGQQARAGLAARLLAELVLEGFE